MRALACKIGAVLLIFGSHATGGIPDVFRLWPGTAPGSGHVTLTETMTERNHGSGKRNRAVTQIVEPTLVAFRPEYPNGAAVIVAPGGGWQRLAFDKEGVEPARWLNRLGVTAFVLKYRLATEGHENPRDVALQDAQRAMRLLRQHAAEWSLDVNRIGFMGFSAGGHLALSVAFFADKKVYTPVDDADVLDAQPDFLIVGYAPTGELASLKDPLRNELLREYRIEAAPGKEYPPAFLFHASNDRGVPPQNSIQAFIELKKAGASAELHIFRSGGHGFGLGPSPHAVAEWPRLCAVWLQESGIVR